MEGSINFKAFAIHWSGYVALAGVPNTYELARILVNYFPLAHVAFHQHTFCLKGEGYFFKRFQIGNQEDGDRYSDRLLFTLEIDSDWQKTLENIRKALEFIEYSF